MWEESHQAPYMYKGLKWVSFDNEESIALKTQFAYKNRLAGVMVWSIDTDDFRGNCGGPRFPLLRTINRALYDLEQGEEPSGAAGPAAGTAPLAAVAAAALIAAALNRL